MPISSMIVHTQEHRTQDLIARLKTLRGVQVEVIKDHDIVLVTESVSQADDMALWKTIEDLPGVMQCDLIYHNFEDQEGF